MDSKMASLVSKIRIDEFEKTSNSIFNDKNFLYIEHKTYKLFEEKIQDCKNILENLKKITVGGKADLINNYSDKIIIQATPLPEKESDYNKLSSKFYECLKKFEKLDKTHKTRNKHIELNLEPILNRCLMDRCEQYFKSDPEGSNVKNCIRDCFKLDLYNKSAAVKLYQEDLNNYFQDLSKL